MVFTGVAASPARCSSRTRPRTAISPSASGWTGKSSTAPTRHPSIHSGRRGLNGSDAPIEELDPLAGVRAGSGERSTSGARGAPSRRSTVQQAFRRPGVTPRMALASDEHRRGQLSPGLPADRRPRPRPVGQTSTQTWSRPWSPGGGSGTRRRGTRSRRGDPGDDLLLVVAGVQAVVIGRHGGGVGPAAA